MSWEMEWQQIRPERTYARSQQAYCWMCCGIDKIKGIVEKQKKTTLSSRQACFVIAHSSGDFNDKNIRNHRLYTIKFT